MPSSAPPTILITGASAGIGAALAQTLAQQVPGVRLVLAARRLELLQAIAHRCEQAGAEVLVVPTDITQPDQVQALVAKTLYRFERVDALVNNAGYGQMGPVELIPPDAVQQQFATNFFGPLTLIQQLIPVMRDQGGGRIVNISSIGGRLAFPMGGFYSASKFALEGISDALRRELQPFNIQVSLVEPGPVATEFFTVAAQEAAKVIDQPQNTPYRAAFAALEQLEQRLNRQLWSAERVARVVWRALGDRHPRARYTAATGGDILLFLMIRLMPTWGVDRFWQKFYGIDRVAQDWRNQAPPRAEGAE